jgi:hypothetical protein
MIVQRPIPHSEPQLLGLATGIGEQLDRIQQQAMALRHEAQLAQDVWFDVLHGGYEPDDVGERE